MWDCIKCGCRAIAASLTTCPNRKCRKERDMPKATVGGSSNAWEALEPGYVAPQETTPAEVVADPEPVPVPEPEPEPAPEPEPVQVVSEPPKLAPVKAAPAKVAPKPANPDPAGM